jgi:uncharacterized protein involved in oxidation of intracellular sulfur
VGLVIILNHPPYGNEMTFNALRLAMALQQDKGAVELSIYLLGDSVSCALPNQMTPQGYYNVERIMRSLIAKGAHVAACSSCLQARGLAELDLIEGVEVSMMPQMASAVLGADKVLTF